MKPARKQGVSVGLLKAAVAYARRQGATVVAGYPVEPRTAEMPAAFAWTGLVSAFRQAGFSEVLRRSEMRPIMRRVLKPEPGTPGSRRRTAVAGKMETGGRR